MTVGAEHPALRAQRDRLWSEHRNRLDETSAEAFEQAMRRDDAAALALLAQSTAIGRLAEAAGGGGGRGVGECTGERGGGKAEAALRDARAAVANAVAAVSPMLPRTMSVVGLAEWLKRRRDSALALAAGAAQARRDHEAARETLMALRADLATALSAAGASVDDATKLSVMEQMADALLQEAAALRERAESRQRLQRALKLRTEALAAAEARDRAWRKEVDTLLAGCWLGSVEPALQPAGALELLAALSDLSERVDKRAETA